MRKHYVCLKCRCDAGLKDEEAEYASRMRKAERQQANSQVSSYSLPTLLTLNFVFGHWVK